MATIKKFRTSNAGDIGYQDINIAAEFATNKTYAVGDYVMYDGNFYICKTPITTTGNTWDSVQNNWTKLTVGTELTKAFNNLNNLDIETDKTLTIVDKPADAAAVGNKFGAVDSNLDDLDSRLSDAESFNTTINELNLSQFKTDTQAALSSLEALDLADFKDSTLGAISSLNATDAATTASLTDLAALEEGTRNRLSTVENALGSLPSNIGTTLTTLSSDLQTAQASINFNKSSIDALDNRLTTHIATAEGDLDVINDTISSIEYELEHLDVGLGFNSGYQDENGLIHLTKTDASGQDQDLPIEQFIPFKVSGGGGGGGGEDTTISFIITSSPVMSVVDTATVADISFKFTSTLIESGDPTGNGTLVVAVNNTTCINRSIAQGNTTINVFPYLSLGANTVKLTITDAYGLVRTRTVSISVESFSLSWSLDKIQQNVSTVLSFYITPTGSGTKTIYTYIDGSLTDTDTVTTSGRRLAKTISNLSHGAHTIHVYGEMEVNGVTIESNHLYSTIAQNNGQNTPIIAINWPNENLQQYTTVNIPYLIIDPFNNPATVEFYVAGQQIATQSVDQSTQIWSYRPSTFGEIILTIKCGTSESHTVTVEELQIDTTEVAEGLQIKVDPATIHNLAEWSYTPSGSQTEYSFTLSEHFDLINGGIKQDSNGVPCIHITAGDRLTLNYTPFHDDAKERGMELKIIYAIRNCSLKTTTGISCMSDNNNIGFRALANNAYLRGNQTEITLSTCEDEKVELDINIQNRNSDKLMYMYESCSTFSYFQYANTESFTHDNPIIFGSDDAEVDIYLIRGYSRDLTDSELLANYIFDGADGGDILERQLRNNIYDSQGKINIELVRQMNPNAHVMIISAPRMTTGKKDWVECEVDHTYLAGGIEHSFHAKGRMAVQGTSSVSYVQFAGANINFNFTIPDEENPGQYVPSIYPVSSDGTISTTSLSGYAMNGTDNSIPTTLLTWKKNVASQDHIINRVCAEWYNEYQPSIRPARRNDPRIRDCLESAMCVVFFHNTNNETIDVWPDRVEPDETVFYGLGNLCSNKDAEEVFDYDPIVIEVKDNTTALQLWESYNYNLHSFDGSFEFRYLDETQYTETQAKEMWRQVLQFVVETDYTTATNEPFQSPIVIEDRQFTTDSIAYRKARWNAEASNYFDMDTLYWHYAITLFFLLRDNRAKNMFWSYSATTHKWGLWFNWDNDTGLCRNNEGYVDIEPGYIDIDSIGTKPVFNASESKLFSSLRENNMAQIKAAYNEADRQGAWNEKKILKYVDDSQSAFCEALWLEDAEHNGIRVLENLSNSDYLARATGKLRLNTRKALKFQKALIDSYFIAGDAANDRVIMRAYTPADLTKSSVEPSTTFKITPYTELFVTIQIGPYDLVQRAAAGEEVTITAPMSKFSDTPIWFCSAQWIQAIGDMSALYLGEFNASNLKRVRKLLIGTDTEGYHNYSFTTASFENCARLEELNLGGLMSAKTPYNFSNNLYLKKIYTKGSAISGITFARGGRLEEAYLNDITSLTMKDLKFLRVLTLENGKERSTELQTKDEIIGELDYYVLDSLIIDNCTVSDNRSYIIINNSPDLRQVRLSNIAWQNIPSTAYNTFIRLYNMYGIADDNSNTAHGVVNGAAQFVKIGPTKLEDLSLNKFPNVQFTYTNLVPEYSVKFMKYIIDNEAQGTGHWELLYEEWVEEGETAPDPVENGLCDAPPLYNTTEYTYTFSGNWLQSLSNVTHNITIYPEYFASTRQYTIQFVDDQEQIITFLDNNGNRVQSKKVNAHGNADFGTNIATLSDSNLIWTGWEVLLTEEEEEQWSRPESDKYFTTVFKDVTSDLTFKATAILPEIPNYRSFYTTSSYAYSDIDVYPTSGDPIPSVYNQREIAGIFTSGRISDFLPIGTKIKIVLEENSIIGDASVDFMLVNYGNHFKLADKQTYANSTWHTCGVLNYQRAISQTTVTNNINGWGSTGLNTWLNNDFFKMLPPFWKSLIKRVAVLSAKNSNDYNIVSSNCRIFLPSLTEMGANTTDTPYVYEIDSGASNKTFSYYTNSSSRYKTTGQIYVNSTANYNSAVAYWTRSPAHRTTTNYWTYIYNYGWSSYYNTSSYYIAPCFCV